MPAELGLSSAASLPVAALGGAQAATGWQLRHHIRRGVRALGGRPRSGSTSQTKVSNGPQRADGIGGTGKRARSQLTVLPASISARACSITA